MRDTKPCLVQTHYNIAFGVMKRNATLKKKLDRLFIVGHIVTAAYAYLLGWWSLLLIPYAMAVFHAGHGAYAHRIFTHNADKTFGEVSNRAHLLGHILFNMCAWGSALVFGAIHVEHHKHSGTELDPHEPRFIGKWNMFLGRYCLTTNKRFFKARYNAPYAKWFHQNYFKVAWWLLPIAAPVYAFAFWARYILLVLVHPREDLPTAADRWWLWPILVGDETHELHHEKPTGVKHPRLDFV